MNFRLNEYSDSIEEAFGNLDEVLKEMVQLKTDINDINVEILSLEKQNPYPISNHKSDYDDIIRLTKK